MTSNGSWQIVTRRYGASSEGFTLMELVVVLVLTGIIATFGILKFGERSRRLHVQAAAEQLAGDLHLARMQAASKNDTVFVVLSPGNDAYEVRFMGVRHLPDGVTFVRGPSVTFAPLGPPRAGGGGEYVLESGSIRKTVAVSDAGNASIR